jgi:uncharacterized protein YaiI (UPF0178 family)
VLEIYVDADGCPVKEEVYRVAARYGLKVWVVANDWLRVPDEPLLTRVTVGEGLDRADDWIAERIGPGDVAVTADVPLAARCVERGARVLAHDGQPFTPGNMGERLALRDLMADLRAADPFRQGGGRPFRPADRARFLEALDKALRR